MSRRKRKDATPILPSSTAPAVDPYHVEDLIVVRESDASDNLLFEEMVYKTFIAHSESVPALEGLEFIGVQPFLEPDKWNALIQRTRKSKTSTFMHENLLMLFHQGSAAGLERIKAGQGEWADLNVFTSRLIELMNRHTPTNVRAYSINRLVRDRDCANLVAQALRRNNSKLVTDEMTFDLHSDMDSTIWTILSNSYSLVPTP